MVESDPVSHPDLQLSLGKMDGHQELVECLVLSNSVTIPTSLLEY